VSIFQAFRATLQLMVFARRQVLIVAFARCLLVLAALVGATACLSSPTLPLPPPSPEEPTVPMGGMTRLQGTVPSAEIGVRVLALNLRTGLIFGEGTTTRRFSFLAAARSGDEISVWYTIGDESSEPVTVTVPFPNRDAGASDAAAACDGGGGCAADGSIP
jgi:hypothetical protein